MSDLIETHSLVALSRRGVAILEPAPPLEPHQRQNGAENVQTYPVGVAERASLLPEEVEEGRETPKHEIDLSAIEGGQGALPRKLRERNKVMTEDITAEVSGGNVFADLGFDNPEEELLVL
ncbi:hypothetical protein NKH71_28930 [Mesorhizobium sp. M0983]|uniref:hypothetical protein n=1 Tax=Mesorhizobium sp. M0983 TaxID=2957040 RepID=UPI003334CD9D